MRNALFLVLFVGIFSCRGKHTDEHLSPSKRFYYVNGVYDINTNKIDRNKLGFTLFDSSGSRIESADLSKAGVQNIGIGWHQTNDTLILNLGLKGIYAYRVGSKGSHEIQIDSAIKREAEHLE
jgi:hypothetical protein